MRKQTQPDKEDLSSSDNLLNFAMSESRKYNTVSGKKVSNNGIKRRKSGNNGQRRRLSS